MRPYRLSVLPHGAGSVEWKVEAPVRRRAVASSFVLAVLLVLLPAALLGAGWRRALLYSGAGGALLALLQAALDVSSESLTYVRLLGVRLDMRRRCGLWGSSHFLPLRALCAPQGVIIHEDVSATRADFFLALPLRPAGPPRDREPASGAAARSSERSSGSSSSSGLRWRQRPAGGAHSRRLAAEDVEVQVVYPHLRPRLSLLRQVYQQLQPLLQSDLEILLAPGTGRQPQAEHADGEQPLEAQQQEQQQRGRSEPQAGRQLEQPQEQQLQQQ